MIKIKPCDTVGNAFMVVKESKFGQVTKLAIGLTKLEADRMKGLIKHKIPPYNKY